MGFKFLKPGKIAVETILFSVFVRLKGGSMTPCTANIHLLNLRQKVGSGFDLYSNSFLDDLLLGVLLTAILFGLHINRRP